MEDHFGDGQQNNRVGSLLRNMSNWHGLPLGLASTTADSNEGGGPIQGIPIPQEVYNNLVWESCMVILVVYLTWHHRSEERRARLNLF